MTTELITLQLPIELYDKLQSLAANKQQDPVNVIVQLITAAYEQQFQASVPAFRTILDHATDLGVPDLAEQHDHYLYGVEKKRNVSSILRQL
jgi:hypothetical protein